MSADSLRQILASSQLCSDPNTIQNTLYASEQNICVNKDQDGGDVIQTGTDLEVQYITCI